MLKLSEVTDYAKAQVGIDESQTYPGMIVLDIRMFAKLSGKSAAADIRLTRNQARELADYLNTLADQLTFSEMRRQYEEKK